MVSRVTQVPGLRDKTGSQNAHSQPGRLSVAMLLDAVKTFRRKKKEFIDYF